ncbi:MAG: transglutaminase family protein [Methylovulum sp.]|nr:transglutaminase family protein [Methylovulum sp.]
MKLRVSCNLCFQIDDAVALIFMLRPFRGIQQWVLRETYTIRPNVVVIESTDSYGNSCQRLVAPQGLFLIHTSAEAIVADNSDTAPGAYFVEIQHLPNDVLPFLLPSRYCESDRFGELAREISAEAVPGYDQVSKIAQWIRLTIQYIPGSSDFPLSATEIHHRGFGVCRDLAHLGIALCRSISIPARIVVGYLHHLEPMDMHAWFEAYVGGRWYTFDPTQHNLAGGRVIVAFGRDAADVPVFHQFGSGAILTNMQVSVENLPNAIN